MFPQNVIHFATYIAQTLVLKRLLEAEVCLSYATFQE